jgi:hypothetical protein
MKRLRAEVPQPAEAAESPRKVERAIFTLFGAFGSFKMGPLLSDILLI